MGGTDEITGSRPDNSTADATIEAVASPTSPTVRGRSWLIVWGVLAVCLLVGALTLRAGESTPEPNDVSLPADVSLRAVSPPSGFTSSELPNGWTRYTSETEGFSIDLPSTWRTDTREDIGPFLRFYATDLVPTYPPITGGSSPALFLMHQTVHEGEDPSTYWEHVRLQDMEDHTLVSEAPMTRTSLRDGLAYVLAHTYKVSYGEQTETVYGLLHGTSEYRIVFAIPSPYQDEYEDVFHDIALTFDIAD
jgi:hypothetical protein